ncbi:hypothetical protein [Pseudomonas fluorescens]|uniref:hypothetical protein n=1 Tax=Pseudomonas fluorescens TaxID=294 RepID=UPI001A9D6DD3|nr:hypothetical protein [Pseudomonas fluorescens]QTD30691.1 hypothetical protein JZM58_15360 [Pseudomonas fluorescens]
MKTYSNEAIRLTSWAAILGGIFAYLNVGLMTVLTQGDMAVTLQGSTMLTLPANGRELFRLSMLADILGFYLPLIAVGGYLWNRFRSEAGALGDMAAMAIMLYVVLGVVGASLQLSVLNPLAAIHAAGGDTAKVAAETTWSAIATASQRGLWWAEGPVVLFWGVIVGGHLKKAGWGPWTLWPLTLVGWCFALFFFTGFFPSLEKFHYASLVLAVVVFPLWLLIFGFQLPRRSVASPNWA